MPQNFNAVTNFIKKNNQIKATFFNPALIIIASISHTNKNNNIKHKTLTTSEISIRRHNQPLFIN